MGLGAARCQAETDFKQAALAAAAMGYFSLPANG